MSFVPKADMKKSSSFSVDLLQGPPPAHVTCSPARQEDDLYFEMEFPVQSSSRLSVESYGSRSTLDSRESPSREESHSGGVLPQPRERPNSLIIPVKTKWSRGDFFGSLPRSRMDRVPKISLPNYSVPVTPADSWEGGHYLNSSNLSGK